MNQIKNTVYNPSQSLKIKKNRRVSYEKLLAITILFLLVPTLWFYSARVKVEKKGKVLGAATNLPQIKPAAITKPITIKKGASLPYIYANSFALTDSQTAYPILEKNSKSKVPIASLTKIMTALVVLENYDLNMPVTVKRDNASVIGSDIQLVPGEVLTIDSLLYGLLIQSGNDAAMTLASAQGSVEDFVVKMNQKSEKLGLKDTRFRDPAGLDDGGYSTASDLAVLASYVVKNKKFAEIVDIPEYTIISIDGRFTHSLKNSNRLIISDEQYYLPAAIGIKTGYTPGAGHCLVSAVKKNGRLLISVILNTTENTNVASAKESYKLLSWALDNLEF